jgi:hypothetical protein
VDTSESVKPFHLLSLSLSLSLSALAIHQCKYLGY